MVTRTRPVEGKEIQEEMVGSILWLVGQAQYRQSEVNNKSPIYMVRYIPNIFAARIMSWYILS